MHKRAVQDIHNRQISQSMTRYTTEQNKIHKGAATDTQQSSPRYTEEQHKIHNRALQDTQKSSKRYTNSFTLA
jgi:hypothetical protein